MKPNVQANTIITNTKLLVICATLLQAGMAAAQTNPPAGSQEITRVGEQASSAGPAEYFTGRVRVDPVWPASQTINASGGWRAIRVAHASRRPAARARLGVGLTQEWRKPVQVMHPGDVVWCPPGVKH
jgi:hypothetical protein